MISELQNAVASYSNAFSDSNIGLSAQPNVVSGKRKVAPEATFLFFSNSIGGKRAN
jgi:hypothetical protein